MLDRLVADFASIWYGIVLSMAIVLVCLAVFVFVSLSIIIAKSFLRRKQGDSITIQQQSLDELAKQVKDLRALREMIDKTLQEVDGENEEQEPIGRTTKNE